MKIVSGFDMRSLRHTVRIKRKLISVLDGLREFIFHSEESEDTHHLEKLVYFFGNGLIEEFDERWDSSEKRFDWESGVYDFIKKVGDEDYIGVLK